MANPYLEPHEIAEDKARAAEPINARLLAALRNITECAEAGADGANMDLWIAQARAAIAEAEAQPKPDAPTYDELLDMLGKLLRRAVRVEHAKMGEVADAAYLLRRAGREG